MARTGSAREALDVVARLPWPWGVGLAALAWGVLHQLAGADAILFHAVGTVFQWIVPPLLLGAAASSYFRFRKATAQFAFTVTADALQRLSWREFEQLLQSAFEAQGFAVQDRGGAGADGGVDLVIRRGEEKHFVQCKHWKAQRVGVTVVRELAGLVATHGAEGGYLITSGGYTREAQEFGVKANLQLLDGPMLLDFLAAARGHGQQSSDAHATNFDATTTRHSRRVRIALVMVLAVTTAAFWVGSRSTETAGRAEEAPRVTAPQIRPIAELYPAPAAPETVAPIDPVDLQIRRAESEQLADEAAMEAAWTAEWKVSPDCEHPVDWDAQVECGNRYIRARRKFESQWSQSALRNEGKSKR